MDRETNKVEVTKRDSKTSRRKFIKGAATVSAFSIIPSQSVWGACTISGAVSGNQSRVNASCTFPGISGGRSPGTWKKFAGSDLAKQRNKAKAMFTEIKARPKGDERNCVRDAYVNDVLSVVNDVMISKATLDYAASLAAPGLASKIPMSAVSVKDGLLSNGTNNNVFYHAATAYLNTYYGMYMGYPAGNANVAADVAGEIFTYWLFEKSHPKPRELSFDSLMMYDGGATTDYQLPIGVLATC